MSVFNGPIFATFLYFRLVNIVQKTNVHYNIIALNREPLFFDTTALSTEPQPLSIVFFS